MTNCPTQTLKPSNLSTQQDQKNQKTRKATILLHSFTITHSFYHSQMKEKALIAFKSKLLNPWRKFLHLFKFRSKRPFFIRALRFRRQPAADGKTHKRKRIRKLISVFWSSSRRLEKMDEVGELRSMTEAGRERMLFPSPLTPAYVRTSGAGKREVSGKDEVEDACRSFENYLVEMIVEEGKVGDLMDVEKLLCCWKNLKCPIFKDLVCRFYGELCKDLFSGEEE